MNIVKFILNEKCLLLLVNSSNNPDNLKNFLYFPSNMFIRLYENFHPTCLFGLHIYLSFGNFPSNTLIWTTLLLGTLEQSQKCLFVIRCNFYSCFSDSFCIHKVLVAILNTKISSVAFENYSNAQFYSIPPTTILFRKLNST